MKKVLEAFLKALNNSLSCYIYLTKIPSSLKATSRSLHKNINLEKNQNPYRYRHTITILYIFTFGDRKRCVRACTCILERMCACVCMCVYARARVCVSMCE